MGGADDRIPPACGPGVRARVEVLRRAVDFERALRTRSRASGPHFALHHLKAAASRPASRAPRVAARASAAEISTGDVPAPVLPVDDGPGPVLPDRIWYGSVVPKRHARRAVTRQLLKRQIRATVGRLGPTLAPGLWVVRLRSPFDRAGFPSAASDALRAAARAELETLFRDASVAGRGRGR